MVGDNYRHFEGVEVGDEVGPVERHITDDQVQEFCKIYGTETPNRFTDAEEAKKVGLTGPIIPGVLSMAIVSQVLGDWSLGGSLVHLDVVFRQPVYHMPVLVGAVVTDKREEDGANLVECDVYISTEDRGLLVGGRAVLSLPGRPG